MPRTEIKQPFTVLGFYTDSNQLFAHYAKAYTWQTAIESAKEELGGDISVVSVIHGHADVADSLTTVTEC